MVPARQGFGTDEAVVRNPVLGLEEHFDLIAVERAEQILFQLIVRPFGKSLRPGGPGHPFAGGFAQVPRGFGQIVQQPVRRVPIIRFDQCNPRIEPHRVGRNRVRDRCGDAVGQLIRDPREPFARHIVAHGHQEAGPRTARELYRLPL